MSEEELGFCSELFFQHKAKLHTHVSMNWHTEQGGIEKCKVEFKEILTWALVDTSLVKFTWTAHFLTDKSNTWGRGKENSVQAAKLQAERWLISTILSNFYDGNITEKYASKLFNELSSS